jgi:hypothetical protein
MVVASSSNVSEKQTLQLQSTAPDVKQDKLHILFDSFFSLIIELKFSSKSQKFCCSSSAGCPIAPQFLVENISSR